LKELNIAVIGLGLGRHFVAACARALSVGRLVVCDPEEERKKLIRREFPQVAEGYGDIEKMLKAERLDAVCIVTPDHMHRPHAELFLESGCHVLMTKPIATNLEDGRAIVRASEKSGKILMVAHERRFRTRIRKIKSLLEEGQLGQIILLQLNQISDKRAQFHRSPWYASAEAGRSAIVGTGIHEVDLLRFMVARPITSICAYGNRLGTMEFPKDKTTATIFQFEGGAIGQTAVSYECHWPQGRQPDHHFLLVATRGVVHGSRVSLDGNGGWKNLPVDESEIATGCEASVQAFLKAIVEGSEVPVPARDAYATLAACVAADEAAALGRPVVPESENFV
jgi:predicted dehydrogenase